MTVEEAMDKIQEGNLSFDEIISIAKTVDDNDVWIAAAYLIEIPDDMSSRLAIISANYNWRIAHRIVNIFWYEPSLSSYDWDKIVKAHNFEEKSKEEVDEIISRITRNEINFAIAIIRNGHVKNPDKLLELASRFRNHVMALTILKTGYIKDPDTVIDIARVSASYIHHNKECELWNEVKKILKSMIPVI